MELQGLKSMPLDKLVLGDIMPFSFPLRSYWRNQIYVNSASHWRTGIQSGDDYEIVLVQAIA